MNTLITWVRFSGLPLEFYKDDALFSMARLIGTPIRIDCQTADAVRGRFARVCVQVDLSKPLEPTVGWNGYWFEVVYEGISLICMRCGLAGHSSESCLKYPIAVHNGEEEIVPPEVNSEQEKTNSGKCLNGLGEWMMGSNTRPQRRRSGNRKTGIQRKKKAGEDIATTSSNNKAGVDIPTTSSNRFNILFDSTNDVPNYWYIILYFRQHFDYQLCFHWVFSRKILCVLFPSGPLGRITLFCLFLMHFRHNGTFGIKTWNKEESEQFGSSPVLGVFSEL
ncbi:hypothetical protein LINGRAHAP2_LOCUS11094 [Linum grandiflorum]